MLITQRETLRDVIYRMLQKRPRYQGKPDQWFVARAGNEGSDSLQRGSRGHFKVTEIVLYVGCSRGRRTECTS